MPLTLASEQHRSYTAPIVIAVVTLLLGIAGVFYFNPHRQPELQALRTDVFAPQTTFKAPPSAIHVVGVAPSVEQNFYAVVTMRLRNTLRVPLFVDEIDGAYVAPNGGELDCVAPGRTDLARLEETFPQIKALMPHPLLLGDTVDPDGTVEGQVLLPFGRLRESDWKARKSSSVTVHFVHQGPVTVAAP